VEGGRGRWVLTGKEVYRSVRVGCFAATSVEQPDAEPRVWCPLLLLHSLQCMPGAADPPHDEARVRATTFGRGAGI